MTINDPKTPQEQLSEFEPETPETEQQPEGAEPQQPEQQPQHEQEEPELDPIERAIRDSLEAQEPKQPEQKPKSQQRTSVPQTPQTPQQQTAQRQQRQQGITLSDGTFIPDGLPRRLYYQAQDQKRRADEAESRMQALEAELNAHKSVQGAPASLGLSPQEAGTALQLFSNWKRNPVGTLQYMLAEAQRMGYTLEGQPNDMGAVARLLDERLQPIMQHFNSQRVEAQAITEAKREAEQFFERYPDARLHEGTLSGMIRRDPRLSPDAAYWMLKAAVTERGLDWNRPLTEQLAQLRGGQPQPQSAEDVDNPMQPPALPRGRARTGDSVPYTPQAELSTRDVVREEMRKAGYKV